MLTKRFEIKQGNVNLQERTFEGYAATFDKDLVDDIIHQGAFQKSINEAFPANRIKVLWQHDEPIGIPIEMKEDTYGLWVKAKVSKTALGDEALELMKDGVIDRMSIGFRIPIGKSEIDDYGVRHIKEVQLMEFSAVTFPANEGAIITAVKDIERALEKGVKVSNKEDLITHLKGIKTKCGLDGKCHSEPSPDTHKSFEPSVDTQTAAALKASFDDFSNYFKKL